VQTLPDITDVRPVDETDQACLAEIRDVLTRHAAIARFGVTLLHDHFPLGDDEILLEVADPDTRTLTIRPGAATDGDGETFVATNFQFDPDAASSHPAVMLKCKVGCFYDLKDRHRRTHDRVW
jgi:hypothetical protein